MKRIMSYYKPISHTTKMCDVYEVRGYLGVCLLHDWKGDEVPFSRWLTNSIFFGIMSSLILIGLVGGIQTAIQGNFGTAAVMLSVALFFAYVIFIAKQRDLILREDSE